MNIINFVTTTKHEAIYELRDRFEFRSDKRFNNVQKILFWLLKKIGAYAKCESVSFERHVFKSNDFIDALFKQYDDLGVFYYKHGERLLIGSEDYSRLMSNPEIQQMVSFEAPYRIGERSRIFICNMKVTIIPWMKGILVLPRNFD
jgi:hypothetical protein